MIMWLNWIKLRLLKLIINDCVSGTEKDFWFPSNVLKWIYIYIFTWFYYCDDIYFLIWVNRICIFSRMTEILQCDNQSPLLILKIWVFQVKLLNINEGYVHNTRTTIFLFVKTQNLRYLNIILPIILFNLNICGLPAI